MRTSGNSSTARCISFSISMDFSSEMLGKRIICGVIAASFRMGMNSPPRKGNKARLPARRTAAPVMTARRWPSAQWSTGV